jgi:peptidoglycan hydrolase-like protein with peptidoglycan-binding domain
MEKESTYALNGGIGDEKNAMLQVMFEPKEISSGDEGKQVLILQFILDMLDYDLGPDGIDGVYGPSTQAAVEAFQIANNLKLDGICGVETWNSLLGSGV